MTDQPTAPAHRERPSWPAIAVAALLLLAGVTLIVALLGSHSHVALWLVDHEETLIAVWLVAYAIVAVAALVSTVRAVARGRSHVLARSAVLVKLSGIPFFVTNFVLIVLVLGVATLLGGGIAVIVAGPLLIVYTYLLMLPTTVYGLGCLVLLWRRREVSTRFVVVNTILHLLFVTDIVSSLVVAYRAGRPRVARPAIARPTGQ